MGKDNISAVLIIPNSPALSPAKNRTLRNAWSLARMNSCDLELRSRLKIFKITFEMADRSLTNKDFAWEGRVLA